MKRSSSLRETTHLDTTPSSVTQGSKLEGGRMLNDITLPEIKAKELPFIIISTTKKSQNATMKNRTKNDLFSDKEKKKNIKVGKEGFPATSEFTNVPSGSSPSVWFTPSFVSSTSKTKRKSFVSQEYQEPEPEKGKNYNSKSKIGNRKLRYSTYLYAPSYSKALPVKSRIEFTEDSDDQQMRIKSESEEEDGTELLDREYNAGTEIRKRRKKIYVLFKGQPRHMSSEVRVEEKEQEGRVEFHRNNETKLNEVSNKRKIKNIIRNISRRISLQMKQQRPSVRGSRISILNRTRGKLLKLTGTAGGENDTDDNDKMHSKEIEAYSEEHDRSIENIYEIFDSKDRMSSLEEEELKPHETNKKLPMKGMNMIPSKVKDGLKSSKVNKLSSSNADHYELGFENSQIDKPYDDKRKSVKRDAAVHSVYSRRVNPNYTAQPVLKSSSYSSSNHGSSYDHQQGDARWRTPTSKVGSLTFQSRDPFYDLNGGLPPSLQYAPKLDSTTSFMKSQFNRRLGIGKRESYLTKSHSVGVLGKGLLSHDSKKSHLRSRGKKS